MSVRRNSNTRGILIGIAVVVGLLLVIGAVTSGFGISGLFAKERNEDNLIDLKDVMLKTQKDSVSDISIMVDELGAVTLNGIASENAEFVYATVTLAKGTYKLTGAPEGSSLTYILGIRVGETLYKSDSGAFAISEAGDYDVVVQVKKNVEFDDVKILPVICDSTEDVEFYAGKSGKSETVKK